MFAAMPSTHAYADDDMVGVDVAAEIAGVHPNTLRRWADAKRVPAYRTPGNQRRFKVSDLRNIIQPEHPEQSTAAAS